jgi:hypothetical protein
MDIRSVPRPALAAPVAARYSQANAEALAGATGATISRTPDGYASVTFDAPPAPAPSVPSAPSISRAVAIDEMQISSEAQERGNDDRPQQPAANTSSAGAPSDQDREELYEYIVDRLSRDLFNDQEQSGIGPSLH